MSGNRTMDGIMEGRNNGRTEGQNDGQKDRTTEGQGESSIAPLFQSGAINTPYSCQMHQRRKSTMFHRFS